MSLRGYKELQVWQKAMDLVVNCYKVTEKFPKVEAYGLTSQLQRAAVSVPANIAEGHCRQYTKEYIRFLYIAYGSLGELETHLQIAERLNYLDPETTNRLLHESAQVGRMLNGLIRKLENNNSGAKG